MVVPADVFCRRRVEPAIVMYAWVKWQIVKFYMSADQFEYWKHTQLILDVTPGRGSSFPLEIPLGVRLQSGRESFRNGA